MAQKLDADVMKVPSTDCILVSRHLRMRAGGNQGPVRVLMFRAFCGDVPHDCFVLSACEWDSRARFHPVDRTCINPAHLLLSSSRTHLIPVNQPNGFRTLVNLRSNTVVPATQAARDAELAKCEDETQRFMQMIFADERREASGLPPIYRDQLPRELFQPITVQTTEDGQTRFVTQAFEPKYEDFDDAIECE